MSGNAPVRNPVGDGRFSASIGSGGVSSRASGGGEAAFEGRSGVSPASSWTHAVRGEAAQSTREISRLTRHVTSA